MSAVYCLGGYHPPTWVPHHRPGVPGLGLVFRFQGSGTREATTYSPGYHSTKPSVTGVMFRGICSSRPHRSVDWL